MEKQQALDYMRAWINDGDAAIVVGTGVSVSATRPQPQTRHAVASWPGLLANALAYSVEQGTLNEKGRRIVELQLEDGTNQSLIQAADRLIEALGGQESTEFVDWLRRTVGTLHELPIATEVLSAIVALRCPLLTTNYDSLLEQATGLDPITWQETQLLRDALRKRKHVLHIHGHWTEPSSIVLGSRSYWIADQDSSMATVLEGLLSARVVIFVGCGLAGLTDPHLGRLMRWVAERARKLDIRHFVLLPDAERADLAGKYEGLVRVSYGEHSQLVDVLRALAPTPVSTANEESRSPALAVSTPPDGIQRVKIHSALRKYVDAHLVGWEAGSIDDHTHSEHYHPDQYVDLVLSRRVATQRGAARPGAPSADARIEEAPGISAANWVADDPAPFRWLSGPAYSGKTITLCRAAWILAQRVEGRATDKTPQVPILVQYRDLYSRLSGRIDPETLPRAIAAFLEPTPGLDVALRETPVLLLVDGLDEVDEPDAGERLDRAVRAALTTSENLRVVVTAADTSPPDRWTDLIFARLLPLKPELVKALAGKRLLSTGEPMRTRVLREIDKLISQSESPQIFESPFMVSIAVDVLADQSAASNISRDRLGDLCRALIDASCAWRFNEAWQKVTIWSPDADPRYDPRIFLRRLAFACAVAGDATKRLQYDLALRALWPTTGASDADTAKAARIVTLLQGDTDLVSVDKKAGGYGVISWLAFKQPVLMQHLAAEYIVYERGATSVAQLKEMDGFRPELRDVLKSIPTVLQHGGKREEAAAMLQGFAEWAAVPGRPLQDWKLPLYATMHSSELHRSVIALQVARDARKALEQPDAGGLRERAVLLDEVGRTAREWFSSFQESGWVPVPEVQRDTVSLEVASTPVLVGKFVEFVKDWEDPNLWSDRPGGRPSESAFITHHDESEWFAELRYPLRPITRVTWYEAMAYCRWLSLQIGGGAVRLPTPQEWKAIARPAGASHLYPWGDGKPTEGDRAELNWIGSRLPRIAPLGLFKASCRPGLFDFGSNVFELGSPVGGGWPVQPNDRVNLFGASWGATADRMTIDRDPSTAAASDRAEDVGFRCVRELDRGPYPTQR